LGWIGRSDALEWPPKDYAKSWPFSLSD